MPIEKTHKNIGCPKVSVYLRNSTLGPSDHYRICQYIPYLNADFRIHNALTEEEFTRNMDLTPGLKKKIYQGLLLIKIYLRRIRDVLKDIKQKPDIVIVQRELIPRFIFGPGLKALFRLMIRGKKLIWDFDDDLIHSKEISSAERSFLCRYSDNIVVTSDYLKSLLKSQYQGKTVIMPTTDGIYKKFDYEKIKRVRLKAYDKEIRLVWIGTWSNLVNVEKLIPILEEAAKELKEKTGKNLRLTVVCNTALKVKTEHLFLTNIRWTREAAARALAVSHIGIMPLPQEQYSLGKGAFKLIQYMSMNLPVIASDIGFNKEVVEEDMGCLVPAIDEGKNYISLSEAGHMSDYGPKTCVNGWINGIIRFSCNADEWYSSGEKAKERFLKEYSLEKNIENWRELIRS